MSTIEVFQQNVEKLKKQYQVASNKRMEMHMKIKEQTMILQSFENFDSEREVHRLIGQVLVERTVGSCTEELKQSNAMIQEALDALTKEMKKKEEEIQNMTSKMNATLMEQVKANRSQASH